MRYETLCHGPASVMLCCPQLCLELAEALHLAMGNLYDSVWPNPKP